MADKQGKIFLILRAPKGAEGWEDVESIVAARNSKREADDYAAQLNARSKKWDYVVYYKGVKLG